MGANPSGIVEIVTDIREDGKITQGRIRNLLQDLGYEPESADYNVAMDDIVPPTTGEAMMSKRAEAHERSLVIDAIIRETLSHPPLAIYTPKEEDQEGWGFLPRDEEDRIGKEQSAELWLHTAFEVSNANSALLISPPIVGIQDTDSIQLYHTHDFSEENAQEIIDTINQT